ncbi:MAG: cyclopropane-fatty-acyl-phospholipid synthase family protein [Rhodothermaceae bacterium]
MIDKLIETGIVPDPLLRLGIRKLLQERLKSEKKENKERQKEHFVTLVNFLKESKIAINTADANKQHYEVPTEFYKLVLGEHLKYSSCYWADDTETLSEAEENMLNITCQRAGIKDGEEILDLGCGWGSLSFYIAMNYPNCKVTSLSNSATQKEYIENKKVALKVDNIDVITSDVNHFKSDKKFDRIVSIEMFEHMRNYKQLFNKLHKLLVTDGKLFVHIFTHNKFAYLFEVKDQTDWMSQYFFTGGIMPSDDLLLYFATDFEILNHWVVNGKHYEKTANQWLKNFDQNKLRIKEIFTQTYGEQESEKWFNYWRVFFMSCAELWGYNQGNEWLISHYLFEKR